MTTSYLENGYEITKLAFDALEYVVLDGVLFTGRREM